MKIQILRGYAVTILTRTFNSAIRGFHYFPRYWSPEKAEKLICLHEENNAFDAFAIKTCKKDSIIAGHISRELSRTHIRQSGKDFDHFDIGSPQKISVGSRRDGNSLPSGSGNVSNL